MGGDRGAQLDKGATGCTNDKRPKSEQTSGSTAIVLSVIYFFLCF